MKIRSSKFLIFFLMVIFMIAFFDDISTAEVTSEDTVDKNLSFEQNLESHVDALENNCWFNKIAIHGILSGAYQHENSSELYEGESYGRGALIFEPEISITPTDRDEFFFKFGFAAGDGVNGKTQLIVSPWAANLESDVKNINGRDRDYLLTAWYKHTFELDEDHAFGLTAGIVDATDYLDQNAYANDEFTQFMNSALVNGPNGFAPSYDIGGALQWDIGAFYTNAVVMNIGENDDGYNYNFFGAEVGYDLNTSLGEGTYRIIYEGGQNAFLDPTESTLEDRSIVFLSCDQQLGENLGVWIRFGWGTDDAAVDASDLYSGGIDISGGLWRREEDNLGLGYAIFDGGNMGLEKVQVTEIYYRLVMNEWFAVTGDLQYQDNKYDDSESGTNIYVWTWGLRAVAEF